MTIVRPTHHRLFAVFDRAHARLSRQISGALGKIGIKPAQAMALVYLGYHDGCQPSELAEGVGSNNAAITGLVERMQRAGLVKRKALNSDGRGKTIHLCAEGLIKREQVMEVFRTYDTRLVSGFTDSEMMTIYRFLAKAADLETVKNGL